MDDGTLRDLAYEDREEFRRNLCKDPAFLHDACQLWIDTTSQAIFDAASTWLRDLGNQECTEPTGYAALTFQLAWWCDAGPYSIDPTPLTDCVRFVSNAAAECRVSDADKLADAADSLGEAFTRSLSVLSRMTMAAAIGEGKKPPAAFTQGAGRPASAKVQKRRKEVARLTAKGLSEGEIAEKLLIPKHTVKDDRKWMKQEG